VPRGFGNREQRLVTHLQKPFSVGEKHAPGGRERHIFAGAVKQFVAVVLLELTDLRADCGL
jgi:hypothetical protein